MKRLTRDQRRERIVKAAQRLFSKKGFRGTTTRELAHACGISEALLFQHFPEKKQLYQVILETKLKEILPNILDNLCEEDLPHKVLNDLAQQIAFQSEKDPSLMRLLLFSSLEGHELSDLFFRQRTNSILIFLKKYFEKAIRARHLKKFDAERGAQAFISMIFGFLQTRFLLKTPRSVKPPLKPTLQTFVKIFLEGIGRIAILIFLIVPSLAYGQNQPPLTLEECYQKALIYNESVRIQEQEIEAAEGIYWQALGGALPNIFVKGTELIQDTPQATEFDDGIGTTFLRRSTPEIAIQLKQPLFQGFREFKALSASQALKHKTSSETERSRQLLFLDVARLFVTIQEKEKEYDLLKSQSHVLDQRIQELNERIRLGKSRTSERLTAQSEKDLLASEMAQVKSQIAIARETFSFFTGISPQSQLSPLTSPAKLETLDTYRSRLKKRPDIVAADYAVDLAQANLRYEKGGYFPQLNFEANYYPYRVGFRDLIDWDLLFTLDIPIFQGGKTRGLVREARARFKQAEVSELESLHRAELEIEEAYYQTQASRASLRALKNATKQAKKNYELHLEEYRMGLVSNLDVLQILRYSYQIQREKNRAYHQLALNHYKLKVVSGDLP